MSGRRASPRRVEQWRRRLERQARGGRSVAEFCSREGVSTAAFYNWKRRLRLGRPAAVDEQPQFVPVELVATADASAAIQIELPGGASLRIASDCPSELAAAAVRAAWTSSAAGDAEHC